MSDGAMCFYCRRYNCICEAESSPPKTEVRRQARIDCQNKTCGEYNCDSCYPPQRVAAQEKRQGDQRCPRCNSEFVARRNMVISDGEPKRCVHFWHFGYPSPSPAATTGQERCPNCASNDRNRRNDMSYGYCNDKWHNASIATTQYCDSCGLPAHKDGVCQFSCPDPITTQSESKSATQIATTQGDDLPFDHDSYVAGFLECKERAARIVDEHDGYLGRVMDLDPEFRDNRVENFTDSQIITTLRNLYEVASGLCDEPIPLSIRSEVERILAPEPKPTPQAEGFEEWWNKTYPEYLGKMPTVERLVANKAWSAAQAPLLAKIAELELEVERLKRVEEFVECTGRARAVLDRAKAAEARIAELESAQPKAEKLVSYDWIKAMVGNMDEDEPTSQSLRELQQYRQREERRER